MKKLWVLIVVLAFGCSSVVRHPYIGKYTTKYGMYGMFGTTIELKTDSTFRKNFRGDMMNDNSYGKWTVIYDTLVLSFDTVAYPNNRYKKQEQYLIKGKKLIWPNTLKAEFKKRSMWDTLSPEYKRLVEKYQDKTMVDFKGTMRENYYKLIK
jgi:hypothetical protein